MGTPSTTLATLRPDLGGSFDEFDLAADRMGFVGHRILPIFETMKQSGPFGKITIESLLQNRETTRAPGGGYNRGSWQFTTDSYATEEHGVEEPVDDREADMYAEYFDAEMVSAERAFDGVLRAAEQRIAAAIFNATTWTPTSINDEWDDASNAIPLTDVESKIQGIYDACGLWPNTMVITRKVFRNLRNVDQIIDRLKYQGFVDVRAGQITVNQMAAAFDIENLIVADSSKNTADEGQAASISPIWSDEYCWIGRTARSNDIREPCVGRTFHWSADGSQPGGTVETYRDETKRCDVVRVRHDVQEKILYTECAGLLANVTT